MLNDIKNPITNDGHLSVIVKKSLLKIKFNFLSSVRFGLSKGRAQFGSVYPKVDLRSVRFGSVCSFKHGLDRKIGSVWSDRMALVITPDKIT